MVVAVTVGMGPDGTLAHGIAGRGSTTGVTTGDITVTAVEELVGVPQEAVVEGQVAVVEGQVAVEAGQVAVEAGLAVAEGDPRPKNEIHPSL